MKFKLTSALLLLSCLFALSTPVMAQTPVVHAVLFFSPTCGHCQQVINETLIPLVQQYGERLQIFAINVTTDSGSQLYQSTLEYFNVPKDGYVVPILIVGDTVLTGSGQIPSELPGMIETLLAQGGNDWPTVPLLRQSLEVAQSTAVAEAQVTAQSAAAGNTAATSAGVTPVATLEPATSVSESSLEHAASGSRFMQDPAGNTLAVIVLVGMLVAAGLGMYFFGVIRGSSINGRWSWIIPAVCILGLGVASYLAFVETQQVEAVCGPVGDCNTVQQSEYARLFGVLPIGVMGVIGYVLILAAWMVGRFSRQPWSAYAVLVMFCLAAFGLAFSIYLTFLEPFVIGASCAWCLTSAVLMTIVFIASLVAGKCALVEYQKLGRQPRRAH